MFPAGAASRAGEVAIERIGSPPVPEGLSPVEAGRGLQEHLELDEEEREKRRNRTISIIEASLLAIVAVLAAYSGWAAAKWSTESSLSLARASANRAEANAANLDALNSLNFDVTAFDTWFTAYVGKDPTAMAIAVKRFTPNFHRAFDAWLATNPETNPKAPPGPTYMPQYRQPAQAQAAALNARPQLSTPRGRRRAARPTTTSAPLSTWQRFCSWPDWEAISGTASSVTASPPSVSPFSAWPSEY